MRAVGIPLLLLALAVLATAGSATGTAASVAPPLTWADVVSQGLPVARDFQKPEGMAYCRDANFALNGASVHEPPPDDAPTCFVRPAEQGLVFAGAWRYALSANVSTRPAVAAS